MLAVNQPTRPTRYLFTRTHTHIHSLIHSAGCRPKIRWQPSSAMLAVAVCANYTHVCCQPGPSIVWSCHYLLPIQYICIFIRCVSCLCVRVFEFGLTDEWQGNQIKYAYAPLVNDACRSRANGCECGPPEWVRDGRVQLERTIVWQCQVQTQTHTTGHDVMHIRWLFVPYPLALFIFIICLCSFFFHHSSVYVLELRREAIIHDGQVTRYESILFPSAYY